RGGGVLGRAAVDRSRLDDRAAGRAQPPEPRTELVQPRSGGGVLAGGHPAYGVERGTHGLGVQLGRERPGLVLVEVEGSLEELGLLAVEDHADVDELLTLDAGDEP